MATVATGPYLAKATVIQAGIEATKGTQAASPLTLYTKSPHYQPKKTWLANDGFIGSFVDTVDEVEGPYYGVYDFSGNFFADTFPILMMSALGSADAIAGSGPYTHTFGLYNTGNGQAYSLSILDWDGANQYVLVAAQVNTLDLTFTAESDATWACNALSQPATDPPGTTVPTSSPSAEVMMPGWDFAVTVGGTAIGYCEKATIKIDRKVKAIFCGGAQDPFVIFVSAIGVTGTLDNLIATNGDPFTASSLPYATERQSSPIALDIVLTDPVSSHSLKWQMSDVQFMDPDRNRGKEYLTSTMTYTAVANGTDAVQTGLSPMKFVATNAKSTTYVGS